jgi:hypothetical protein
MNISIIFADFSELSCHFCISTEVAQNSTATPRLSMASFFPIFFGPKFGGWEKEKRELYVAFDQLIH